MKVITRFFYTLNRLRWWITHPLTVGGRLLLVREGCVLLVQHTYQPMWFLPGGGVNKNETLEQAARREAKEKLGAVLENLPQNIAVDHKRRIVEYCKIDKVPNFETWQVSRIASRLQSLKENLPGFITKDTPSV